VSLWHDMKTRWHRPLVSQPRWDGNRVLFSIKTDGRLIPCAISRSALENLSGHTHLATSNLLRRFLNSRDRIEDIAARISYITPKWVSGPVNIWSDDINNPPPSARSFGP
jgi:Protein of unknown function (DUF1488)